METNVLAKNWVSFCIVSLIFAIFPKAYRSLKKNSKFAPFQIASALLPLYFFYEETKEFYDDV